ncbi:MAG TPA: hypothetical protein VKV22_10620 [Rhodanobacteraceae bacterium]|nr:hypothetical protein [Rhodanobacteraceae bacterium]
MTERCTTVAVDRADTGAGSAWRKLGAADWLHLAATPVFGALALLTGTTSGATADMLCPATGGMSLLGGMAAMYLLMGVFHAGPWLKLLATARRNHE